MTTKTPTHRMFGRTKIDALDLDSSAWWIDGEQVTASAADLNTGVGTYNIYNNTGGALSLGMPLYISGYDATSGYPKVVKADADDNKPAMLFAHTTTANGSTTTAVNRYSGAVTGFDTSGTTVGYPVYLSETAGSLTYTAPTNNDAFVQIVGYVVSKATSGVCVLDTKLSDKQKIGSLDVTTKFLSGFGAITPVANADSFVMVDATGTANATATVGDVATMLSGTVTSTGLAATSGVVSATLGYTAANVDVANDDFVFLDHNASHIPQTESIADLVTGMAGSGLTATSGVLAVGPDSYPQTHVYCAGALTAGELLHISGWNVANACPVVEKADADGMKPADLIAVDVNAGAAVSHAAEYYLLTAQTTVGAAGTAIYLDATTAGAWTETAPTGADQLQQKVGYVTIQGAGTGAVEINTRFNSDCKYGTSFIAAKGITAATLGTDVAGDGLSGGNGAAIALDLNELTGATIDVGADSIGFIDASDNTSKKETLLDMINIMAPATYGITNGTGVLKACDYGQYAVGTFRFGAQADCTSVTVGAVTYTVAGAADYPNGIWTIGAGTAAQSAAELIAAINGDTRNGGSNYYNAYADADADTVYVVSKTCTTNAALSRTGGAQPATTLGQAGGRAAAARKMEMISHTVTADDVDTSATFAIYVPFTPTKFMINVVSSAGVPKTITDQVTIAAAPNRILITSDGLTHCAATDVVTVWVSE